MVKKLGAAAATGVLFLGGGAGAASAHPVGEPGEPNCHGKRVSHGASVHGLTPKDRAGFGGMTVQEYQERVRMCSPPPGE